jgi:peroxiredoxin
MKRLLFIICLTLSWGSSALVNGKAAPNFKLKGSHGTVDLSQYKGKFVVLEWFNHGCPFVRKHYDSKNMQKIQKKYKDNVVWLAINSSASGKQGHLGTEANALKKFNEEMMGAKNLLLDNNGKVGKKYGAKTTPHMYIIDPNGKLIYQGAIDSTPSANPGDIKISKNYVDMALEQALTGRSIKTAKTRPYGCSVKY